MENTSTAKERGRVACLACRESKKRCSGAPDDHCPAVCSRCRLLGLECRFRARAKRGTAEQRRRRKLPERSVDTTCISSASVVSTPDTMQIPSAAFHARSSQLQAIMIDRHELWCLVRQYFGTVHHYGYLSFIHEPHFFRLLERGDPPRSLTALMIACALRSFAGDGTTATLARADEIYEEAFGNLLPQMYQRYGAIDLMTALLARIFEHARGRFSSSWMLVGNAVRQGLRFLDDLSPPDQELIAGRMMQYMSLHTLDTTYPEGASTGRNPLLQREALRRLAWAVFYVDCMVDAGLYGVHTIDERSLRIRHPCSDETFLRGDSKAAGRTMDCCDSSAVSRPDVSSDDARSQPPEGISCHLVQTMAMRRKILHFHSSTRSPSSSPMVLHDELDAIQAQLQNLIASLPPSLAYSEVNLFVHAAKRTAFMLLHALRHNCFLVLQTARLELYKIESSTPTRSDPSTRYTERIELCLQQRLKHAMPTANIIHDAVRLEVNCDPFLGSLGYTALELIVLDPVRLRQLRPLSVSEISTPSFTLAIERILRLLRKLAPVEEGIANLRIEACRRLLHFGFGALLDRSDHDALKTQVQDPSFGLRDDQEYDLTSFYWHRYERRATDPDSNKERLSHRIAPVRRPVPVERLLDPLSTSTFPSRSASPTHQFTDAGTISAGDELTRPSVVHGSTLTSIPTLEKMMSTQGNSFLLPEPFLAPHNPPFRLPLVESGSSTDLCVSNDYQDSLAGGLLSFFEFDNSLSMPVSTQATGLAGVQWAGLDLGSWAGDAAVDGPWLEGSTQPSAVPDQLPLDNQDTYSEWNF